MKIRRFLSFLLPLFALLHFSIVPDEGGGGVDDMSTGDIDTSGVSGDTSPDGGGQASEADAPKSLLEAISRAIPEAKDGNGNEVQAAPEATEAEKAAAAVAAKPGDKQTPTGDDLTKMPDGLNAKAQDRFQKLANANKEVTAAHEQLKTDFERVTAQVEPFREALQTNGVTREQFEQATSVIGLMNKGDFQGAIAALDEQRRLISLAMGKPLPGVDALSEFADLRQAVDSLEITEERALEIARSRAGDAARASQKQRQQQQRDQQEQQRQQQADEEAAVQTALQSVDAFTQKMKTEDLDFAVVEAKLLPEIPGLLKGVPPQQWAAKVEALYGLIKKTAGAARRSTPHVNALRSTGGNGLKEQPATMLDAMFPGA